ncbi:MAG: 3-isopropylmalate dehydratase small subunit [Gemmatimonadetes bacterium]|nr:3-isopropylmalate dehydratase small subunit [Gemmatimonadota bacterium]
MEPIRTFSSRVVALPMENIDTDQIIPARYLKVTDKAGLGEALFADWRYDAAGRPRDEFALNQPAASGARILVGGHNFGCGSSREHAPWALLGYGFRAVVSTYFADIFANNALKNGLLPIVVEPAAHARLLALAAEAPDREVTVDLRAQTLTLPDGEAVDFPIDPFARECLLQGLDQLGFILAEEAAIERYEAEHPPRVRTVS